MEKYKKRPHSWLGKQKKIKKNAFQEAQTQKRFAFAATNETSSRQHQRPRCALPPSPRYSPASPLFGCSLRRIMATDALQLARRHVTWSTHSTRLDLPYARCTASSAHSPVSRLLLLHTLCGYLCLSLSMLSSAHGSLQQKRIFMLWPMFVLFELYVAFSIPYSATSPPCSNALYELSL